MQYVQHLVSTVDLELLAPRGTSLTYEDVTRVLMFEPVSSSLQVPPYRSPHSYASSYFSR